MRSPRYAPTNVDAVVVATPTSTHHELATVALEAGKHVLVEKPLADSAEHAEALCELAQRTDLVLMVGHIFVYNAAARRAKEYIGNGELGRVYYISMERTNLGPIRADVNAAWDLAAHDVSLANYWLNGNPVTASAVGGAWINPGIAVRGVCDPALPRRRPRSPARFVAEPAQVTCHHRRGRASHADF